MNSLKAFARQNIYLLMLLVLTLPAYISLIRPGFFSMQDDLQALRIHQMDKCFQDFQIPCRWVPDQGYQYGYPQFEFYPPSVYYLGEFFHLSGFQFIDSVKILFILGFVLSAVTMFIFLRSLFSEWPALVGAILYTYAPYKAVDVYVRGAMSEFWALVFFPLIFWSSYQSIKTSRLKYLPWLALSTGLLLITHNLMSLIFLPVAGIWSLTWILLERNFKALYRLALGFVLGAGLAAFFSLPLVIERQYAHLESLVGGYFGYQQHFVDLNQLFLLNNFAYGSSVLGPTDDLSLSTGPIHWMVGLIAVVLALVTIKRNPKVSLAVIAISFVELTILFLMHSKSSFIWDRISVLEWLQFPWRLLADSIFLLSFLGASAIYFCLKSKLSWVLGVSLILAVFILHVSFFHPKDWYGLTDQEKFSGKSWQKQLTTSIFDYLPIYAKLPPIKNAPGLPEVLEGDVSFKWYKKGSNYQMGEAVVKKEALLRLPLFDYPGMKVWVNGKQVVHWHDDCRGQEFCLGLITFKMPSGNNHFSAKLTNTWIREVSNLITFVSIWVLFWLFYTTRKYDKAS